MKRAILKKYMPSTPWTARKLQEIMYKEAYLAHQRGDSVHTTSGPPGVGKSGTEMMEGLTLLTKGIRRDDGSKRVCKGIIIAVPLIDIGKNYFEFDGLQVEIPAGPNSRAHRKPFTAFPGNHWGQPDLTRPSTRDEFKAFFGPDGGGIIVVTHIALGEWMDLLPKDLSEYHLAFDEAHHGPRSEVMEQNTRVGDARDRFVERGATVSQWSATPWHTESETRIFGAGESRCLISVLEAQLAGLAPENLEFHRRTLTVSARTLKDLLLTDVKGQTAVVIYESLVEQWLEDRKPYTLVRLLDRQHVDPCKKAFEEAGARVLVVAGDDFDREALRHEQNLTDYRKRRYDVVLACRRFDEGVDLPAISNVYYIGAPTSSRLVIQLWGRGWRKKNLKNYPKHWVNRCAFHVFVPSGKHALDDYLDEHMRQAIIIATYLADVAIGERILGLGDRLREGLMQRYSHGTEEQKDRTIAQRKALNEIFGDEVEVAEAAGELNQILIETARERAEPVEQVDAESVLKKIETLSDPKMRLKVYTLCQKQWEQMPDAASQDAAKRLGDVLTQQILQVHADSDYDNIVHDALQSMEGAVRLVVDEFPDIHEAFYFSADKKLWEIISTFTSTSLKDVGDAMNRLVMPNPQRHEVRRVLRSYWERHQQVPTEKSGATDKYGLVGYTFGQIASNWALFGLQEGTMNEYCRVWLAQSARRTPRKKARPKRRR